MKDDGAMLEDLRLSWFAGGIKDALSSDSLQEVLRQYAAVGVARVDDVEGWLRYVLARTERELLPTPTERELCNHYIARTGGTGIRVFTDWCQKTNPQNRNMLAHLKSLRRNKVRAMMRTQ